MEIAEHIEGFLQMEAERPYEIAYIKIGNETYKPVKNANGPYSLESGRFESLSWWMEHVNAGTVSEETLQNLFSRISSAWHQTDPQDMRLHSTYGDVFIVVPLTEQNIDRAQQMLVRRND